MEVPILLIGGTTASGKSALALRIAGMTDGIVVNADAQQLYRDLPILTAQPGPEERARVPHRLYGILPPEEATTVGLWLRLLAPVLEEARRTHRPLLLVGGTGMYLKCLLHGLAPVPEIPAAVRRRLRALDLPGPELHARLRQRDPVMAARLRPGDRQRILRALEVVEATGRSLAEYHHQSRRQLELPGPVRAVALLPRRAELARRIERRIEAMLAAGLLEELSRLARQRPDLRTLPIARVHGCRELLDHLEGRMSLDAAIARIATVTRQYAKRQSTFFRRQLPEFAPVSAFGEELGDLATELAAWLRTAARGARAGGSPPAGAQPRAERA